MPGLDPGISIGVAAGHTKDARIKSAHDRFNMRPLPVCSPAKL